MEPEGFSFKTFWGQARHRSTGILLNVLNAGVWAVCYIGSPSLTVLEAFERNFNRKKIFYFIFLSTKNTFFDVETAKNVFKTILPQTMQFNF